MFHYGIMQGRLTKSAGRGIQFFPFEYWEREFEIAAELGLDEIEWIFDYERYEENPLWTKQGREALKSVIRKTGVSVRSVCFDYFMRRPFFKAPQEERQEVREENQRMMESVLLAMKEIGAGLIEIPLVDDSSMKSQQEKDAFAKFLLDIVNSCDSGILFGLETDLPPREFAEYLDGLGNARVGANYDSGNSSGIGYEPYEEVTVLGRRIFNIHIKDRILHGTTVALGTGSADFDRLFLGLREIGYGGSFIMQAARGQDGQEKETIASQVSFVRKYVQGLSL